MKDAVVLLQGSKMHKRTSEVKCRLLSLSACTLVCAWLSLAGCQTLSNSRPQPDSMRSTLRPDESTSASQVIRGQSPVNRYAGNQQGSLPTPPSSVGTSGAAASSGTSSSVGTQSVLSLPGFPSTTSEATIPSPANGLPAVPSTNSTGNSGGVGSVNGSATQPTPPAWGYGEANTGGAYSQEYTPGALAPPSYEESGSYGNSYGAGSGYASESYGATIAPGAAQYPFTDTQAIAPGAVPYVDPSVGITAPGGTHFQAPERIAPIDVYVQEARTGRIILGGSVNSDLGVAGQLVIDERNFNIRRFPRSFDDIRSGRAFRGGGQNFRMELMPGSQVERYTVSWTERNLLGYLPYSLSVGGFYYTRQFRDWTEQRIGGRVALGYEVTKDIAVSSEIRMEDVKLFDPRVAGVQELDDALGSNDIYTARFRVARDTRDSPFMSTEGSLLELVFDQVFGEYDFSRGRINYSKYNLLRERPDGTGRHVLASTFRLGFTGSQTPVFENFFAGGYSSLRGFSFRGAGPVVNDVQVGGEFMALGSFEYVFPLTADDMLRGVAFVDYGTVEDSIELNSENFRVAPGLGLRVAVPALGPAPLAFDFAYPINHADTDDRQVFSFFMGFTR